MDAQTTHHSRTSRTVPQGRTPHRWRWAAGAAAVATLSLSLTAASAPGAAAGDRASGGGAGGRATTGTLGTGALALRGAPGSAISGKPGGPVNCGPPRVLPLVPCYTPQAYEAAYGVAPLLSHGIDGRGVTVVVPELAEVPSHTGLIYTDIRQDLASFDSRFHLPAATLRVVNGLAHDKTPYLAGTEEVEDTEIVHAIAPGAALEVVLVPHSAVNSPANFAKAITEVIQTGITRRAAVISISASGGEHVLTHAEAASIEAVVQRASDHHVTVVASSGDGGAISDQGLPKQVSLPASDPLVLAAGGTTLDADFSTGAYKGELAWNELTDATGGGYSVLFPRPSYQNGIPRIGTTRGVPDVAADADDRTGMALAFGDGGTVPARGTSAATPLWAAIVALADQEAGHSLGFVNPAIYQIASGADYHRAFHDVLTGDNSVMLPSRVEVGYSAGPGWDPVTGWGSPNAQVLVPLLAHGGAARS